MIQCHFPLCGHLRRFNLIRQNRNQCVSIICRHQIFLFPFYKARLNQFFNDCCPCCRCAKSFLFRIFGQFFISCTFHCRKQGIFCVLFRWLCKMLRYKRITGTIMLACPDIQLRLFFLNLYAKELFQSIFDCLESFLLCFLCCEIKRMIITGNLAFMAFINIKICSCCQYPGTDQIQNLAASFFQFTNICLCYFHGWDNRMVIGYFL